MYVHFLYIFYMFSFFRSSYTLTGTKPTLCSLPHVLTHTHTHAYRYTTCLVSFMHFQLINQVRKPKKSHNIHLSCIATFFSLPRRYIYPLLGRLELRFNYAIASAHVYILYAHAYIYKKECCCSVASEKLDRSIDSRDILNAHLYMRCERTCMCVYI